MEGDRRAAEPKLLSSPPLLSFAAAHAAASSEPSMARAPQAASQALLGVLAPFLLSQCFVGEQVAYAAKLNAWVRISTSVKCTDPLRHEVPPLSSESTGPPFRVGGFEWAVGFWEPSNLGGPSESDSKIEKMRVK